MRLGRTIDVDAELRLTARQSGDADEMFALIEQHRADLREWLTWIDATRTVGDVRRYAQFAATQFERLEGFDFALRRAGALAGSIGLHHVDWHNRTAQIGYWLAPPERGRGLLARAARALTDHAFGPLEMYRLEIRCVVDNARSRRVAERLGFAFEGVLAGAYLLHGRYCDIALYATTVPAWRARRGRAAPE